MGACAQARLVHSGCMARNVVLPYPPRTSACRERPVRTTLIFNTFRENVTTVRQTSPEGYSIRCGRSAFFIISVHHRHFCCSHFYCFGANRIKIAKSVQKTSKSNIFCTDFIIFPILAKISSYKRPKSPVFVFFYAKKGVFNTNFIVPLPYPHQSLRRNPGGSSGSVS